MNLPFYIARRYFIAKKSTNAVNLITGVSIFGVAIGTAAMIAVLSGFNGLETLIRSFYNTFDPDLKIEATGGKYLQNDSLAFNRILQLAEIENMSFVLEDKALVKFRDKEYIATIKGVDANYARVTQIEQAVTRGDYFGDMDDEVGVVGIGVAYHLNLVRLDFVDPLSVYVPKTGFSLGQDPMKSVTLKPLYPVGIFSVQPDYDVKYIITPLTYAQQLFSQPNRYTAIEIKLKPGVDLHQITNKIAVVLGEKYTIHDRDAQQATIFRVIKVERLATFLILAFILTIASFGILGALIMLVLEKKDDINTLRSLGFSRAKIKRIFFNEGLLITAIGCAEGVLLGVLLVLLQDNFGLLGLGQGYAVDAYPVQLRLGNVLLVAATVSAIGIAVSALAVRRIKTDY